MTNNVAWQEVDPARARELTDARKQLHHAAQLATAFGISYLPAAPDDSHTNLLWSHDHESLVSNSFRETRVAVRVRDLTLTFENSALPLRGKTIGDAEMWLRDELSRAGLPADRLTLARHYEIPEHRVDDGAAFDAPDEDLDQLSRWFSNAASLLEVVRGDHSNASEVRCWPHHFDIATLITVDASRSAGVGMEPGDTYYDEPYFYVNMHPAPEASDLPQTLEGNGQWHTHEWIGAVLPGSRIDSANGENQARAFLKSAITAATALVTRQ